ncbi:MAG: hypothetical protein SOX17_06990 [Prevotella sp.]|nr:hypothetical protein [Prevotella sp.]MDD7605494.1 hypothetical protein [Prevotellaceae bacterium]MDY3248222.1 hypothetical protein [Prevotella sp.]
MTKLYLDVDGVLLTAKNTRMAPGAIPFIEKVLSKFDCYWLTTNCRDGNAGRVLARLSNYYPDDMIRKMQRVKPTEWKDLKTDAIDFSTKFFWVDDYVFEAEKRVLRLNNCLDRLIMVNLSNVHELQDIYSTYLSSEDR